MSAQTIRLDFRLVSLVLLIVIALMLVIWRPWQGTDEQTIAVSGEATVRAAPDMFMFYPVYQATASTSEAAISEASKIGNNVAAKLQELGVEERLIKTSVSVNSKFDTDLPREPGRSGNTDYVAQYSFTITVNDKELARKVLDYLVTTSPLYGVSPQSTFSREKRKVLENEARGKALADAKARGEQTASELGVRRGRVVSVSEPQWGGVIPFAVGERTAPDVADSSASSTPPVLLTGEEEVTYTIQVTFRIR